MQRLSYIIVFLICVQVWSQSPHEPSLRIDCAQCHNAEGWTVENTSEIKFDHGNTGFELEGAHETTDCRSCHASLIFNEAPNDCISCHTDVHFQSVGNDCVRCHTSENWLVFDIPEIHEQNGFPLIGAHTDVSCVECHNSATSLIFTPLGNECIQCHQDDYFATQNPNHAVSGFSTDCIECHSPLGFGWDAGGIIHDFFPLTLGHDIQDCSACHDVTNFSNISSDCFSCHSDDYAQTSNPNHNAAGFPTDCAACHSTNPGWMPATINHDFFPLTLGHDIQDCSACHDVNNFSNISADCFSCHEDDYAQTTNPNHPAAGFPTDCASCHTTNPGWMPATFNHDPLFPIYSGKHDDVWTSCTDCHSNPNNFAIFQCLTCHPAGEMNDEHEGVNGYVYESNACLACHPTGEQ